MPPTLDRLTHPLDGAGAVPVYVLIGTSAIARGARWNGWSWLLGNRPRPTMIEGDALPGLGVEATKGKPGETMTPSRDSSDAESGTRAGGPTIAKRDGNGHTKLADGPFDAVLKRVAWNVAFGGLGILEVAIRIVRGRQTEAGLILVPLQDRYTDL